MIRVLREFRLIPIVLIAAVCLFALKVFGLALDGNYIFGLRQVKGENFIAVSLAPDTQELSTQTVTLDNWAPPKAKQSWLRQMFGFSDGSADAAPARGTDVSTTGSVSTPPKPAAKEGEGKKEGEAKPGEKIVPVSPKPTPMGTVVPLDGNRPISAGERAVLERLHERRQELDKRARELDMRENMLKEAETKLDMRMNELKTLEGQVGPNGKKKEEQEASRFKSLAVMYENMKAKDAAKIFDRLDIKVLIDMSSAINPRRMSEIMGQMSPEVAERLTSELAARANGTERTANPSDLPKIEGKPSGS
jgi:flagellar motility protein MotE (MotC chaperone)